MRVSGAYILLVEDNLDDVELTLRSLKRNNLMNDVKIVRDGVEALDFLFSQGQYEGNGAQTLPQLILLDINLPKVNGLEVLKAIRNHDTTKLVPVVMLTSSKEERDVLTSYTSGANSYVQKPVNFAEFTEAVRQLGLYWLVLNEPPERRSTESDAEENTFQPAQ